jgi:hypothetical protein
MTLHVDEKGDIVMEQIEVSKQVAETNELEQRMVQWRQKYQRHLESLAEFRRWQANFTSQMALHEEHVRILKAMHTDLRREAQRVVFRRATRS